MKMVITICLFCMAGGLVAQIPKGAFSKLKYDTLVNSKFDTIFNGEINLLSGGIDSASFYSFKPYFIDSVVSAGNDSNWAYVSFFNKGTGKIKEVQGKLEILMSADSMRLFRATDGRYRRIDGYTLELIPSYYLVPDVVSYKQSDGVSAFFSLDTLSFIYMIRRNDSAIALVRLGRGPLEIISSSESRMASITYFTERQRRFFLVLPRILLPGKFDPGAGYLVGYWNGAHICIADCSQEDYDIVRFNGGTESVIGKRHIINSEVSIIDKRLLRSGYDLAAVIDGISSYLRKQRP